MYSAKLRIIFCIAIIFNILQIPAVWAQNIKQSEKELTIIPQGATNFKSPSATLNFDKLTVAEAAKRIDALLGIKNDLTKTPGMIASALASMDPKKAAAILALCKASNALRMLDSSFFNTSQAGKVLLAMDPAKAAAIVANYSTVSAGKAAAILDTLPAGKSNAILSKLKNLSPQSHKLAEAIFSNLKSTIAVDLNKLTAQAAAKKIDSMIDGSQSHSSQIASALASMDPKKAAAILAQCNAFNAAVILNEQAISKFLAGTILASMDPAQAAAILANCDLSSEMIAEDFKNPGRAISHIALTSQKAAAALDTLPMANSSAILSKLVTISADTAAKVVKNMDSTFSAATLRMMNDAEAATLLANNAISAEKAVEILAKIKNLDVAKKSNILVALEKIAKDKAARIQEQLKTTTPFNLDLDRNGKFDFNDVTYMFNNLDTLSVGLADFNCNDRVDFGDIVALYNKLGGTITSGGRLDFDKNGVINSQDTTYMFNNMDKLSVSQADLNNNGRVDFADVVIVAGMLGQGSTKGTLDYDGNGRVNFDDTVYMFNNMANLSVAQADLNKNNRVDFADIVYMFNLIKQ